MVVDGDMNEFPTITAPGTSAWVGLTAPITGDAVADPLEAAELLDVHVDQLAELLAFIADDRLGRLQVAPAVEAVTHEDAGNRCP